MTPYPSYMLVSLLSKLFDFSLIGSRFSGVLAATAKSRPPHPAYLHFMASTTSRGVVHHILPIISGSPESLDAHYLSYNSMPSYSYAPNLSVHMHTINNSQRERSQSTHKVSKRRRIAPSWDVVDERPPHQLVHGDLAIWGVIWKDLMHSWDSLYKHGITWIQAWICIITSNIKYGIELLTHSHT